MGDISAEPSMEEILSSIKRIIAEEGDGPNGRRRAPRAVEERAQAPASRSAPPEPTSDAEDEVLELSDPIPAAAPMSEQPAHTPKEEPVPEPVRAAPQPILNAAAVGRPTSEPILSAATTDATRGALESLTRLMVKPEPQSDGTLEGLVRDMLRPMLREWLDAHLPDMVEAMVSREIARISGQTR